MGWFNEWVGSVTLFLIGAKLSYNLAHLVYTWFLGAWLRMNIDPRQHGPWAVVTGSTDGIGKAFAFKLASLGLDIVLVSRSAEKLEDVADEIKRCNDNIQVKTIAVNFTNNNEIYAEIRKQLEPLDIGILINNVGMATSFGVTLCEVEEQQLVDIVNCNIVSMVRMTRIVLPQMLARKKGIIINIGSLTGVVPTPFGTIYAATKAFVDKFSTDLSLEVSNGGVLVQTVHPGYVVSNMSKIRRATMTVPMPDVFVEASLRTLGLESRTAAFWFHKVQFYLSQLALFMFPTLVGNIMVNMGLKYRKRMLDRKKK